jgi:hypothetical protein
MSDYRLGRCKHLCGTLLTAVAFELTVAKMSDKILIVKYFGQAAPQLMDLAARSLPRASHIVSQGLAGEPWLFCGLLNALMSACSTGG